jgi:hypothetical protein
MESSREYAAESTEVPATWGILNSLFIVFCPVFQNGGKVNIIFGANEIWTDHL